MDVREVERFIIAKRRFTIPDLQRHFSLRYPEARALVALFEKRDMVNLMSGLDFVVPSTSLTTAGGERVFSLRALCDSFADATEQEYKALVYAYLHKEVDKRELSRFVDVSYEEGDKMVYWLKLKKVYDSQGKKRLIALEKLAIVLETLEEEKGYFSENGDDDPFDF